eukprot:31229-Pelagococcus_subviridis.AAC.11
MSLNLPSFQPSYAVIHSSMTFHTPESCAVSFSHSTSPLSGGAGIPNISIPALRSCSVCRNAAAAAALLSINALALASGARPTASATSIGASAVNALRCSSTSCVNASTVLMSFSRNDSFASTSVSSMRLSVATCASKTFSNPSRRASSASRTTTSKRARRAYCARSGANRAAVHELREVIQVARGLRQDLFVPRAVLVYGVQLRDGRLVQQPREAVPPLLAPLQERLLQRPDVDPQERHVRDLVLALDLDEQLLVLGDVRLERRQRLLRLGVSLDVRHHVLLPQVLVRLLVVRDEALRLLHDEVDPVVDGDDLFQRRILVVGDDVEEGRQRLAVVVALWAESVHHLDDRDELPRRAVNEREEVGHVRRELHPAVVLEHRDDAEERDDVELLVALGPLSLDVLAVVRERALERARQLLAHLLVRGGELLRDLLPVRLLRLLELALGVHLLSNDGDENRGRDLRAIRRHLPDRLFVLHDALVRVLAVLPRFADEVLLKLRGRRPVHLGQPGGDVFVQVRDAVVKQSPLFVVQRLENLVVVPHDVQNLLAQESVLLLVRANLQRAVRDLEVQPLEEPDLGEQVQQLLVEVLIQESVLVRRQQPVLQPLLDLRLHLALEVRHPLAVDVRHVLLDLRQRERVRRAQLLQLRRLRQRHRRLFELFVRPLEAVVLHLRPHRGAAVFRLPLRDRRLLAVHVEVFLHGVQLFREGFVALHALALDASRDAVAFRHRLQCPQQLHETVQVAHGVDRGDHDVLRHHLEILHGRLKRVVVVVPSRRFHVQDLVIQRPQAVYFDRERVLNVRERFRHLRTLRAAKHGQRLLRRELHLRLAHLEQVLAPPDERVQVREQGYRVERPLHRRVILVPRVDLLLCVFKRALPRAPRGDAVLQRRHRAVDVVPVQDVVHLYLRDAPVDDRVRDFAQ